MSPAESPALGRLTVRPRSAGRFTIRLWDVTTGKQVRPFDVPVSATLAFASAPDGRELAAALSDGTIMVWETASGKPRLRVSLEHPLLVSSLAYSPDGRVLAGGDEQAIIHLWDTMTGKEIACFEGHQDPVQTLAFAPDGSRLVSGSADTSLLV